MKIFVSNSEGNDIFYVEVTPWYGVGNMVESSLPESIFDLPEILDLLRQIFKTVYGSVEMDMFLNQLINLLSFQKQYSGFYFQDSELKSNGKFNHEQNNTMEEMVWGQELVYYHPITLYSAPFIFRWLCNRLHLFKMSEFHTISKAEFELNILGNPDYWDLIHWYSSIDEFRKKEIKNKLIEVNLLIKYSDGIPVMLYFSSLISQIE